MPKVRPSRALSGLLLTAAFGTPASAAPRPDYSIAETRRIMFEYGRCVVRRAHASAVYLILDHDGDIPSALKRHPALNSPECLIEAAWNGSIGSLRLPFDMYRYVMADALVSADFPSSAPDGIAEAAPLEHRSVGESAYRPEAGKRVSEQRRLELEEKRAQAITYSHFSRFGECVVRNDAANAHALLMANPNSAGETNALARLASVFSGCLVADRDFAVNRVILRGTIAVNFYRLANAPRSAAPGVTH